MTDLPSLAERQLSQFLDQNRTVSRRLPFQPLPHPVECVGRVESHLPPPDRQAGDKPARMG